MLVFNSIEKLANDQLQVNIQSESLERVEKHIAMGFRRQASAITGAGLFLGGAVMVTAELPPIWYWPPLLLASFFFIRSMFFRRY